MNIPDPCDLHIHSYYSDGKLSPAEIIKEAGAAGLSAVSITDHDTVAGQSEAIEAGNDSNVEVIPGVEFSVRESDMEIHILGYLIDHRDVLLREKVSDLEEAREARAALMVDMLRREIPAIRFEEVKDEAGDGVIGRPHIASVLLRHGIVDTFQEAFNRYIGNGKKCWIPKKVLSIEEVCAVIRGAGGIPVWAHPGSLIDDEHLVGKLIAAGVRGLEVWHPNHGGSLTTRIEAAANRFGLVRTGGSDYHFDEAMKAGIGEIGMPYSAVIELKDEAERHLS
jgi:predicted metal-dependent phosphoesterase TrpH